MTKEREFRYKVHPISIKMYHDLNEIYWWNNMKKDVANLVDKYIDFQQVKVEHLRFHGISI